MKILSTIATLCIAISIHAQTPDSTLVIGNSYSIYSNILNEQRSVWIHLPKDYEKSTEKYPVIILLDGELFFLSTVAVISRFQQYRRDPFPDVVLVGITNTDRTRDLTPTPAISSKGSATMENSGGAPNFLSFIEKELLPYLETNFMISDRRILVGHSFAGLFGAYTLSQNPKIFTDYLLMDPSFWWDDQKLLEESDSLLSNVDLSETRLYLAASGKNHRTEKEDARNLQEFFIESIKQNQPQSPIQFERFPEENHGSLFLPALSKGLRWIFLSEDEKH